MIADGKQIAKKIEEDLAIKLKKLPQKKVCFLMFGENLASAQFVGMKTRLAERLGIKVVIEKIPVIENTEEACNIVQRVSLEGYDGIVVQLPLPKHLDTQMILNSVPTEQDIDVLGEKTKELFVAGDSKMVPPVAKAVSQILTFYKVSLEDKKIVVVGSGKLVGEPVAMMLSKDKIPFFVIDKETIEEEKFTRFNSADVIISGAGEPHLIKPQMIKEGVILVDAGTSEQAGIISGDVDPTCSQKASIFTPVPGGVGPVTVVCLFENLLSA